MTRRIVQACNIIMEITWLLALVTIPLYFNIYTSRVFEPDKITLFRSFSLVLAGAWLVKALAVMVANRSVPPSRLPANPRRVARKTIEEFPPDGDIIGPDTKPWQRIITSRPLVLPALVLCFVYIVATLISISPDVSFWGGYDRLQGTYTFFSYVIFFLTLVFNLSERRQLERLISFVLLTGIPVTLYGILQHNKGDPLPWQGDTTFRVTSTMGNAIFISAYLIMVVPLVLYRVITIAGWLYANRAARSVSERSRNTALSWFVMYGGFIIFEVGLFYVVLNLNANYRPEQTGIAVAASQSGIGSSGSAAGTAQQLVGGTTIGPWWSVPIAVLAAFGLCFLFTVRRKDTDNNFLFRLVELACYVLLLGMTLLVIVYSQSRGPLAGMLAGLYLVPPILFAVRKKWKWLTAWLGIGVLGGVFLVLFNLTPGSTPLEPAFSILRKTPEIARLGEFLQTDDGTGKVRRLIWQTDFEILGNAAKNDPIRLLLGNGPETMYYISPKFYQVELGYIEARNAIPDRSHNAYLDALVTTGILGFLTYLAFIFLFFYYSIKFIRQTKRFDSQVLLASLMAIMLSHMIEIATGIQIVSSWMMFWLTAALVVIVGGFTRGSYAPQTVEAQVVQPIVEPIVEDKINEKVAAIAGKGGRSGKNKPVTANNSTQDDKIKAKFVPTSSKAPPTKGVTSPVRPVARATASTSGFNMLLLRVPEVEVRPWFWSVTVLLGFILLAFIYLSNFAPIIADVSYKQGQNLASSNRPEEAAYYFSEASRIAPSQDRYDLYLGQVYLDLAETTLKNPPQTQPTPGQTPTTTPVKTDPNANFNKAQSYYQASERELLRARELAPLNPDHYANLARLYGQWSQADQTKRAELTQKQLDWYDRAIVEAPRNSRIRTEYAAALVNASRKPDGTVNQVVLQQAVKVGEDSITLDPKFDFGRWVLGDIYLSAGRNDDAAVQYAEVAKISPKELGNNFRYIQRVQLLSTGQKVDQPTLLAALQKGLANKELKGTDKAFYQQTFGMYQFYRNNFAEAEPLLLAATQGDPAQPYSHAYLAVIYQRSGRAQQAQTEGQRALDLAGQQGQEVKATVQNFLATNV